MKIAFITTYPPRECGIGSFANCLAHALRNNDEENELIVIAMTDNLEKYVFPPEVKLTIHQESQTD